jgi:hypothetical protein
VNIDVEVLWVVTPSGVAVGPLCLHLHFTLKVEATRPSEAGILP